MVRITDPKGIEVAAGRFADLEAAGIANAFLDETVDRLAAGLLGLDESLRRFAALAERWDRAADKLEEHSVGLATQARCLAASIRAGVAQTASGAIATGRFVGKAGAFTDAVSDVLP